MLEFNKFDLNISVRNYFFTSEGAVLYFQQLSIARNQVSFYANNYIE